CARTTRFPSIRSGPRFSRLSRRSFPRSRRFSRRNSRRSSPICRCARNKKPDNRVHRALPPAVLLHRRRAQHRAHLHRAALVCPMPASRVLRNPELLVLRRKPILRKSHTRPSFSVPPSPFSVKLLGTGNGEVCRSKFLDSAV